MASFHIRKVDQTGYGGTAPRNVDTSAPDIISAAPEDVQRHLSPVHKAGIPSRAGVLDENVNAWASPDKKIGAGYVSPMSVVNDMEVRDIKDTAAKVWDRLTSVEGTADGEKRNANQINTIPKTLFLLDFTLQ